MITTQIESFRECLEELKPLLPHHYEELALNKDSVPLDPQWDVYFSHEDQGGLLFVTLRSEGRLIGYYIGMIYPGLHYKTCLTCHTDIFFIHPDYRGQRGGKTLFCAVEDELRRRGVNRWFVATKKHKDAGFLLEKLNFKEVETVFSKML